MPNTYTQLHIHVVFTVRKRASLIGKEWEDRLYQYISGIVRNQNHKLLAINGMPDHIHILMGIRPNQSLSDLVKMIKQYSSRWIKQQELTRNFSWQSGYGAFSHSRKELPTIINYINRQEDHHRTKSFREEYLELLEEAEIDFDHRYLFEPVL